MKKSSCLAIERTLTLTNDAARRLNDGELWFGKQGVVGRKPKIAGIVSLIDKRKKYLGMAFFSPDSRYYLRVFLRSREKVDKEFWRRRIRFSYEKRAALFPSTNAFRVVHGEADGIPSVVIDKYNDIWSFQISSSGAEAIKPILIEIIEEEFSPFSVIEKNNLSIRKGEGLELVERLVLGSTVKTTIKEGEERFEIDVLDGHKTGAYLDYRAFRTKAAEFAGKRCLDAFCYEGWFACRISRAAGGVIAVDSSQSSIEAAKKNAIINGHDNIEFVKADVFEFLERASEPFDFIHLDPPSFAKGRRQLKAALAGYKKLIRSAFSLLNSGGRLMVSSCSHAVSASGLEGIVMECARKKGIKGEVIYRGIQDDDHPVLKSHPESLYLKALTFKMKGNYSGANSNGLSFPRV